MMGLTKKRIILCGMGTVGKAFARLLDERREQVAKNYGLDIEIAATVDVGGAAVADQGALPLDDLLVHVDAGETVETFSPYGRPGLSGVEAVSSIPAEVMLETTPTNLVDGEPARGHILAALNQGLDVVSANKGPLVLFQGILNGTTNYILTRMHVEKCSYETALQAAQEMGIAETDPTLDVEGLDTRNKIVVIANRIFDKHFGLDDVAVEGITRITPADIDKAIAAGYVIKLVGSAELDNGDVTISVGPKTLALEHPLAAVNYAEKSISYLTDTMGRVTVTGGKSSPVGAAAALLKDLIHTVMLAD
jgi:homoserine dehydrogenase